MKTISCQLIVLLLSGISLLIPVGAFADQNDQRLDELFTKLKSSDNPSELQSVESSIWEIWFESGRQEVDSLMQEAGAAVQYGELRLAEDLYSQIIEKAPNFAEGWNRRATVRYYQSDFDGSFEDIKQTLILEPRHFGATWGLGMILGSRGEFSKAISAFERLLEIKPNAPDAKPRIEFLKEEQAKGAV